MQNIEFYVIALAISLCLSAFFSSSETAFISLQRFRIQHLISKGVRGADKIARFIRKPERFLSAVLFGNTLVNAAAASLTTAIIVDVGLRYGLSEPQGILIATVSLTVFLLIFCEVIPKTIAIQNAEKIALIFQVPLRAVSWLMTPFVIVLSWIGAGFTHIVGGTSIPRSIISDEEIRTMISVGLEKGTVAETDAALLHRIFEFGDRPAYTAMIPRVDIVALEKNATIADFMKTYGRHPKSRYPVYHRNIDNVVGVVSIKDVFMSRALGNAGAESTIAELVRPVYFAPETKRINELFFEMRDHGYRVTVIVDEYGGTNGIVTLSSLVAEIVGEIGDELTSVEKDFEVINEYTYQIEGGMRVSDVNREMGLDLPLDEDYETVAGFILNLLGYIPRSQEQVRYRDLKIVIAEMKGQKIEKIILTREARQQTDTEGGNL
jgi:putative hemolysin